MRSQGSKSNISIPPKGTWHIELANATHKTLTYPKRAVPLDYKLHEVGSMSALFAVSWSPE